MTSGINWTWNEDQTAARGTHDAGTCEIQKLDNTWGYGWKFGTESDSGETYSADNAKQFCSGAIEASRFQALAREVVKLLDGGWEVIPPYRHEGDSSVPLYLHLQHLDARLYINAQKGGKISISGGFQDHRVSGNLRDANLTINVSASKSAEQIAADIKRRLLPGLAAHVKACRAEVAERADYEALTLKNAQRLAGMLKTAVHGREGGDRTVYVDNGGTLRIEGARVQFERFSVSADEAETMLAALLKLRSKGAK